MVQVVDGENLSVYGLAGSNKEPRIAELATRQEAEIAMGPSHDVPLLESLDAAQRSRACTTSCCRPARASCRGRRGTSPGTPGRGRASDLVCLDF